MMKENNKGCLYIVSTPIGNMGDISQRAIDILQSSACVACEDTRRTGLFLSRIGIKKKLVSYHNYNESKQASVIIEILNDGADVAVVSDAGTPGVSDPAYRLVRAAVDNGFEVFSVPGPSSVLAALVVSGLPLDRFVFEGFLPPKGGKRIKRLENLADEERTIIIFESPHKIMRLLDNILETLGDREISVSREMTKLHEETVRGNVSELIERLENVAPRGEYTVVIRGIGKSGKGKL